MKNRLLKVKNTRTSSNTLSEFLDSKTSEICKILDDQKEFINPKIKYRRPGRRPKGTRGGNLGYYCSMFFEF